MRIDISVKLLRARVYFLEARNLIGCEWAVLVCFRVNNSSEMKSP